MIGSHSAPSPIECPFQHVSRSHIAQSRRMNKLVDCLPSLPRTLRAVTLLDSKILTPPTIRPSSFLSHSIDVLCRLRATSINATILRST